MMSFAIRQRGWGYWVYLLLLIIWAIIFTNTILEPGHSSLVSGKDIVYFVLIQYLQLDLIFFLVYAVCFRSDVRQGSLSWIHFPILLINCYLSLMYACQYSDDTDLGIWEFLLVGKLIFISLTSLVLLGWTAVKYPSGSS